MKKKVLNCSIIIIALCLFGLVFLRFSSTDDNAGNDGIQYMLTAENLASGESRATFLYFEEESIIYYISQNGIPNYYRYYFERQENVLLGNIPDFYIGRDEVARLGDKLYFFAGVKNGFTEVNRLFCIDLNENILVQCSEYEDQSLTGITAYRYKDNIVTLKNILNADGSIQTFLDSYNPETNEWITQKKELWKSYEEDGIALFSFYATEEKLYSIQDEYTNSGEDLMQRLIIYDEDMKTEKDYILTGGILEFIGSGRVIELSINDELIFLKNTSSYGYLGILHEDGIDTIITNEKYLEKAHGESERYGDGTLFFLRRSNILYLYDEATKQLLKVSLDLNDRESLRAVFVNGDYILIVCYLEDKHENALPNQLYIMPFDNVLPAT